MLLIQKGQGTMECSSTSTCRVCLQNLPTEGRKLSDPLRSFYSKPSVTYLDAFEFCTGYVVGATEPQGFCEECASELLISYHFKEKCQKTQNEMQKWLENNIKQEEEEDFLQVKLEVFADSIPFTEVEDTGLDDCDNKNEDQLIRKRKRERNYKCDLCGRAYTARSNLLQHYNLKHDKHKTATCPHCHYKHYPQLLETHIERCRTRLRKERDAYYNDVSLAETKGTVTEDEDKKTIAEIVPKTEGPVSEKKFKCNICGRNYTAYSNILQHYNNKHSKHKIASCSICKNKYYPQFLDMHIEKCRGSKYSGERKSKITGNTEQTGLCPICGVIKPNSHILKHLSNDPNVKQTFVCDICGSKLKSKSGILTHMKILHLKIPYKCRHCPTEVRTSQLLETHIRIIHPHLKNVLKCEFCDYTSVYHASLRTHRATHTGRKYHKCDICQKDFIKKTSLKDHMVTHFDERPFSCELCGATFKSRRYLTVHKRVHQEHDYECPVCQRTFSSNQLMTNHAKTKHPQYQLPPPGTVMSKSYRMKVAEKKLKQEALRKGLDKESIEAIVVTEPPPLEELHMMQYY